MAIPNCTYYESLVTSNPVKREPRVGPDGLVRAPTSPGIALPDFVLERRDTGHLSAVQEKEDHDYEVIFKHYRRRFRVSFLGACVAIVAVVAAGAASGSSAGVAATKAKTSAAPLVVWYDAARAAYVKEYKATHPGANIKWVLYSGDNNGDGTLQSKFSLYNRVGWKPGVAPDVVFDEENYEAGWLGEPPFNDLLDLKPYIPKSVWSKDEGLGDCLINGKLLCLRNDNAANVLWVNTKLWNQFFPGQPPPTTWAQYAADGQALVKNHPGYYIGEFGQPWDAETYLWGNECPINEAVGRQTLCGQPEPRRTARRSRA